MSIRAAHRATLRRHGLAALLTAIFPPASAALVLWLMPSGCDLRGDPAIYRWTCLLPGLLISVPPVIACVLPVLAYFNHRLEHRIPDGWLVTTLAAGLATQLILVGGYVLALNPAYRSAFIDDLIFIPQPFLAGAIGGAIYWITAHCGSKQMDQSGTANFRQADKPK